MSKTHQEESWHGHTYPEVDQNKSIDHQDQCCNTSSCEKTNNSNILKYYTSLKVLHVLVFSKRSICIIFLIPFKKKQTNLQLHSMAHSVFIVTGNHNCDFSSFSQVNLAHDFLHDHVVHVCCGLIGGIDGVLIPYGLGSLSLLDTAMYSSNVCPQNFSLCTINNILKRISKFVIFCMLVGDCFNYNRIH